MQPLLLLHGALGSAETLMPLAAAVRTHFQPYALDFPGHGGLGLPAVRLSIPVFAEAVLRYLDEKGLEKVPVFGYSMGGYVALYLARHHPERIAAVATLATKLHWDAVVADREAGGLNPDVIEAKVPRFAETLRQRHAPADWRELLVRTANLLRDLGDAPPLRADDFRALGMPVLLLRGDRDAMVTLDETVTVYQVLTDGALGILPRTPHPLEKVDVPQLAQLLRQFFPG